jgi:crotonobetainyl-CoA:carnitine CoA-transferase CaiB-like acyl-CoA transferase
VFVTNLRANALARMGLDHERLLTINPRLIYCAVTGYGVSGPDRDRPAYDIGAYWSRAAIAASLRPDDGDPPQQRGGMGDHTTAISAVAAVCAYRWPASAPARGNSSTRRCCAPARTCSVGTLASVSASASSNRLTTASTSPIRW